MLRKCWSVRCGADMASARCRIVLDQPSPAARPGRHVRGSCSTRPLRQNYITPHCPQCQPVSRKLLLCLAPLRALRVKATGGMQNCLRWSGCQSSALPGRFAPYAPPPVALVVCGHLGISQALRAGGFGQWRAATYVVCAPPTLGACLLRSIARAVCPSAPKGLPAVPRKILHAVSKNNAAGASRLRCSSTTQHTSR